MKIWRWLSTPSEPKGQYIVLTAIGTFVLMVISSPLWTDGGALSVGIAGAICAGIASSVAKLWMERAK